MYVSFDNLGFQVEWRKELQSLVGKNQKKMDPSLFVYTFRISCFYFDPLTLFVFLITIIMIILIGFKATYQLRGLIVLFFFNLK